jgi:hypothetical protein
LKSATMGRLVTTVDGNWRYFPSTSWSSTALCCFERRRAPSW